MCTAALAWLQVLAIEIGNKPQLLNADLGKMPHLQVLIKTPEDRESLRRG